MLHNNKLTFFAFCVYILLTFSCTQDNTIIQNQKELFELLEKEKTNYQSSFSIINQITDSYRYQNDNTSLILFLTDFVEKNPDNPYNAYWLLLTAYTYMQENADSVAEYYFDRIIQNYDDLLVKGKSVHILCLQNLIQISTSSDNRIYYFNQLITRFPDQVNITELYRAIAFFTAFSKASKLSKVQSLGELLKSINFRALLYASGIPAI